MTPVQQVEELAEEFCKGTTLVFQVMEALRIHLYIAERVVTTSRKMMHVPFDYKNCAAPFTPEYKQSILSDMKYVWEAIL